MLTFGLSLLLALVVVAALIFLVLCPIHERLREAVGDLVMIRRNLAVMPGPRGDAETITLKIEPVDTSPLDEARAKVEALRAAAEDLGRTWPRPEVRLDRRPSITCGACGMTTYPTPEEAASWLTGTGRFVCPECFAGKVG